MSQYTDNVLIEDFDSLRIPPHSIQAEQSVLGGLFLDNSAWMAMDGMVSANDFYRQDHQLIFNALSEMAGNGIPLDVITVSEWMAGRLLPSIGLQPASTFLEACGGLAYLGTLAKDTPSAANIAHYAKTVRNYAMKRRLISVAASIMEDSYQGGSDDQTIKSLLDKSASLIFEIEQSNDKHEQGFIRLKDAVKEQLGEMQKIIDDPDHDLLGHKSNLSALDEKLSGWEDGKVYVIAGRPAMGKTTLALNIVEGIASHAEGCSAVFSMEMPYLQIAQKIISSQGVADFGRIRNPNQLDESDWSSIGIGVKKIAGMEVFLDDSSAMTPANIRTRCRRIIRERGKKLNVIMVDYVQLMDSGKQFFNSNDEIKEVSKEMRKLAKDFSCPVLLLSQLNRSVESRPNKRPVMSDLRESGALEQDASVIIFIYRDEVYNEDTNDKGVAELIIAKQRGGTVGTVRCAFQGQFQRFQDYEHEYTGSNTDGGWQ